MTSDLVQLMQQLSFSLPSAVIYEILLQNGPTSPTDLSTISGQRPAHLDQTVQVLMSLQLIAKDYVRNRPIYYARDPTIAWLALEADLVWETDTSLLPARLVPSTGNPTEDELRATCVKIIEHAEELYKPHSAALSHKVRDANTPDELMRLTCELLYHASKYIYAASKSPRLPHVAQFWTVLTKQIEKGVRYHRVADLEEVIDHGLSVVTRDMNDYSIDLRILEADAISHTFYLVDGRFLATHHYKTTRRNEVQRGVGRITNQAPVVGRYKKRFLRYLDDSIPGRFVESHLRKVAGELLRSADGALSSEETDWVNDLIELGKFSKFHKTWKWNEKKTAETEQKLIELGFVRRNDDGFVVPLYPTDEREVRQAFLASQQSQ
jgi:hypothetical protein